jgi:predicted Zn-dependent protease
MARAGYDPLAMADTFATLQRIMRVNGVDVPEFLLDHPVDTHRIADAKARAQNLTCSRVPAGAAASSARSSGSGPLDLSLPSPRTNEIRASRDDDADAIASSESATVSVDAQSTSPGTLPRVSVTACGVHTPAQETYFELMRARARVLASDTPSKVRAYYADNLQRDPAFDTPPNRYGYALALTRAGAASQAVEILRKLAADAPSLAVYRLALADALDQSGKKAESLAVYEQLGTDFPGSRAITLSYADALIARADADSARRAQELLRPLVERYAGDPDLQSSYARACQLGGDKVRAAEAYAEAAYLNGHAEDALNQLKTLSKEPDLTFYQRSRVDARITELTPEVLALRKRSTPEPDSPGSLSFTCCRR